MSSYGLDEIIKRWGKDELTTEQAIGQILLLLQGISERVGKIEMRQEAQRLAGRRANEPFLTDKPTGK